MKVIDLLNKIAHGEEVPEKIKVGNIIYIYENWEHFYYTDNEAREDLLVRGKDYSTNDFLNWNVELIEDEVDIDNIEELLKIEEYEVDKTDTVINRNKINELVQVVKQLDKRVKELEELNIEINEKDINEAINKAREQLNKEIKSIKGK